MSREYTYKGYQNHISENVSLGIDKPNNISRNNGQLAQFAWNGGQPDLSKLSQLMNCMEIDWGDATWDGTEVNIDDLKNGNGIANVRSSYDVLRLLFWCVKQLLKPAVQYTITYNIDGGSGTAPASQTVNPGTVIQLPTYSGTKPGYNSKDKWIIGSQEYAPGSNYTVNSNVTAKWKWEVIPVTQYTVTFVDRGTTLKTVTGPTGKSITPPSDPTRSGYDFMGWNTNQNASTGIQVISTIGTSNITYYAIWKEQVKTAYYWYVGQTEPTQLPTNDSDLVEGTNPGWRKIGDSKPNVGTILFDGRTSIYIGKTKVPYYFACNSDINIWVYDSLGNICETFIEGPQQNNGINVYKTTFSGKSFNNVLKIV